MLSCRRLSWGSLGEAVLGDLSWGGGAVLQKAVLGEPVLGKPTWLRAAAETAHRTVPVRDLRLHSWTLGAQPLI